MSVATALDRPRGRGLALLVLAVASAALVLQYMLLLVQTRESLGPALGTLRYFSYFTILSNILVALTVGAAAFGGGSRLARCFASPFVRGGVALYIGVTGVVYFTILRHLWQPQGAQWWADTGLHYAVPLLYLAWWGFAASHGQLRWGDLGRWLLFPFGYLLWCLLRGAWVHEYPYPFIDVDQLGLATVLRNAVGMLLAFVVAGTLLIAIDRVLGRGAQPT